MYVSLIPRLLLLGTRLYVWIRPLKILAGGR